MASLTWTERNRKRIAEAHAMRRVMWVEFLHSRTMLAVISADWLGEPVESMVQRHQPIEARRATTDDIEEWGRIVVTLKQASSIADRGALADRCAVLDKDDRLTYLAIKMIGGRGRVPRKAERAQREWMRLRQVVVQANMKLIGMLATRFCPANLSIEDALDAAKRGATKAVDRYDETRGAYSKCAALWIRHEVKRKDGSRKHLPCILPIHELGSGLTTDDFVDAGRQETWGRNTRENNLKPEVEVLETATYVFNQTSGHEAPTHARVMLARVLADLPARVRKSLLSMNETRPDKAMRAVLATLRERLERSGVHSVGDLLA